MKFSRIALLGAATFAVAQPHNHAHRHPARHASPVEARDVATVVVPGAVETVYELNGQIISWADVQEGIKEGKYILVGGQVAPASSASSTASPTPAATSATGGQFAQKVQQSTSSSSAYVAPAATSKPATSAPAASATASSSSSSSSSSSGSTGDWPDFPSGTIACSTFPSEYGAVAADWLGLEGWTGVQNTPNFEGLGVSTSISYIETAISGSSCTSNSFCSYACPAGYQKSQWPSAQGSTGQSIGGLYCNSDGMLELSSSSTQQLCIAGTGGISVKNTLGKVVSVCRTDYPGTESETVALAVEGGSTEALTCPDTSTYYFWEGKGTSAQYYINPSGYEPKDACWWNTDGSNLGNYAPVNAGVGSTDGTTYISLFQNSPTNTNGKLDFSIAIKGTGCSGSCTYSNGVFYKDGVVSSTGCTVAVSPGGSAYFEFS